MSRDLATPVTVHPLGPGLETLASRMNGSSAQSGSKGVRCSRPQEESLEEAGPECSPGSSRMWTMKAEMGDGEA